MNTVTGLRRGATLRVERVVMTICVNDGWQVMRGSWGVRTLGEEERGENV